MNRNIKTGVYTQNGVELKFKFYTSLKALDKIRFVKGVSSAVVENDYNSVIRNLMFDFEIINTFTDIDVSYMTESDDAISMIEEFIESTNIVDIVIANAEDGVVEELNKAVDENIEYRTGIHKNPLSESLSRLLDTIEKKVAGLDTDSIMKMANVINGMTGEATPEKLFEAYIKSDLFKENRKKTRVSKKTADVKQG